MSLILEIPSSNFFQSKLFQAFPHPPATFFPVQFAVDPHGDSHQRGPPKHALCPKGLLFVIHPPVPFTHQKSHNHPSHVSAPIASHTHPSTCSHRLMLFFHPRTYFFFPIFEVKIRTTQMASSFKFHSAHPCQPSSETFLRPSSVPRSRPLGTSLTQRLAAGAWSGTLAPPSTVPPTSRSTRGGLSIVCPTRCCVLRVLIEEPNLLLH